jgi:hypothetical protein
MLRTVLALLAALEDGTVTEDPKLGESFRLSAKD